MGSDSDPDLGLDGVFARTIEIPNSQVLFGPFEEEFDAPARTIQFGDGQRRQLEFVREEHASLGLEIPKLQILRRCRRYVTP